MRTLCLQASLVYPWEGTFGGRAGWKSVLLASQMNRIWCWFWVGSWDFSLANVCWVGVCFVAGKALDFSAMAAQVLFWYWRAAVFLRDLLIFLPCELCNCQLNQLVLLNCVFNWKRYQLISDGGLARVALLFYLCIGTWSWYKFYIFCNWYGSDRVCTSSDLVQLWTSLQLMACSLYLVNL